MKWLLFVIWLLTGALYLLMLLWSLPHLTQIAGGLPMFDMRPGGYSYPEAQALLMALGTEGRGFYLAVQHRLDTLFPGLEALALGLAFWRLFPRRFAVPLACVALAGAVFDWLENAAVAVLLRMDPGAVTPSLVAVANRWTVLKSSAVTLAMTALLLALILALWRHLRSRRP